VAREPFPSATREPQKDMLSLHAVLAPYNKTSFGSCQFTSVYLEDWVGPIRTIHLAEKRQLCWKCQEDTRSARSPFRRRISTSQDGWTDASL
jgi:hypothetical protein